MKRLTQIGIAMDQLANALAGGWADETISARSWRCREESKAWAALRVVIDKIFFWQKDHCQTAYVSERMREHMPVEYREAGA